MQKEKSKSLFKKSGKSKNNGAFVSIEKKISKRFAQTVMLSCIILGMITAALSWVSSVSAVSETINDTSDVAV